ncbi:MAG TPA: MMPL family transporter, partial [Nitrososphaerales archaeon]|nr:MMPL family transporter [Nitrososphaerales archaeon]
MLASNVISAQFQKTVPNSTLLIVVSGKNVSDPATQTFVNNLLTTLKDDKQIEGLNQSLDVYNKLYAAIQGVNTGAYSAMANANKTGSLLFGVPAAYIGYWEEAYSRSGNVTEADTAAYGNATVALGGCTQSPCPPGPVNQALQFLPLFNSTWADSWTGSATAGLNLTARIQFATSSADESLIAQFSPSAKPFSEAVAHAFNVLDYLSPGRGANSTQLSTFAVDYISNTTSYQTKFVGAAFTLGATYSDSALQTLAGNIIWSPRTYDLDPGLTSLVSSLVSPQKDTTLITLGLDRSSDQNLLAIRADSQNAFDANGTSSGIEAVQVTGQDAISYDFGNATQADLGLILPVTIGLLIVATGLFFRSVLTPFVTLGSIGVALGISQVFVVLVATYVAKVDFTIPTVLLTVLIGVGTDYSVFVIARYREERVKGGSVQQSVETSVTWAGESIATSGATVIISFLALSLTSITFLKTMGVVVGLGVLVALSVALTLVPAIIGLTGARTFWPTSGARFTKYAASVLSKLERKSGYFSRSGAFAVKHAKVLIVIAFVVSAPAVYVYANTTPTYDFLSAAPSSLESVAASNHLTASFGAGTISPTYVVVIFTSPLVDGQRFNVTEMNSVEAISTHLAAMADVRNVTSPTRPYDVTVPYASLNTTLPADKRTTSSVLSNIGKDNRTALITVNFAIDPYSTQAISDAQAIRNYLQGSFAAPQGVQAAYVGGASGSI